MRLRRSDTENWCWLYANSKHRFMTPCFLQEKCQNNLYSGPIGLSCCLRLCDRLNYWRFLQSPPNKVCSVPEDWFWKTFSSRRLILETVRFHWEDWLYWQTVGTRLTTDFGNCSVPEDPAWLTWETARWLSQSQKTDLGNCSVLEVWLGKLGSFAKADWLGETFTARSASERPWFGKLFCPRRLRWETAVQSQKTDFGNCSVPAEWLGKLFSPRRLTWENVQSQAGLYWENVQSQTEVCFGKRFIGRRLTWQWCE